ncbi:MAG: phosphodiester glycosidase family protein, partial [Ruminiclostridium sp.]|nr:phosphodiester glycosidase family protein [Ruminiclostridium sp.]
LETASKGKYPVFIVSGGKASLKEIKSKLWLKGKSGRLEIDNINKPALKGETVVYTPIYGSVNRAKEENLTIEIKNKIITGIDYFKGDSEIPEDGMLVSLFGSQYLKAGSLPFDTGDTVELIHEPQLAPGTQAYECGSWIVKGGNVVIGSRDEWVGVLTNQDPRTAIGIKGDGTVVLIVVDGRQPGYSSGMTGKALGEFLTGYGVVDAAMLDGGASSEMIFNGAIVNKPSFKGQERPLAGGLLIIGK